MNEENKEFETEVEKVEETNTVKYKKKSKAGIFVPIIAAVVAFVVVYGGITLVNYLGADKDVVEKNDIKEDSAKEDSAKEEDNSDDETVVDTEDVVVENVGGTTGPDEVITITEDMKAELNRIASIGDGFCFAERLFFSMNGFTKDLSVDNKRNLIINYYLITHKGSDRINELTFKEIADKYSFTESFDTIMAGYEKVGNEYVLPPVGCVGPERTSHNATYQDTGNTITVIDNVTITNTENSDVRKIKVIYTFIYSKDSNNNITFKLHQVNNEQ